MTLSNDTKIKILWYLLLSALGVFHAEVLSWSQPGVLIEPATFALVTPVYAVHYILFGDLMGRYRDKKAVLYVFGCLTGMYETFITKVYWSPPWNPEAVTALGVAWVELLWIGFTWHAFMSFLIPFTLMSRLFTPGGRTSLKARDLRAILIVGPFMGATLGYGFGQGIEVMLPSVLLSLLVISVLAAAVIWGFKRWGFTSPDQLAFGGAGRKLAISSFLGVYVGYSVLLRPEFIPFGIPIVTVLSVYAGLAYLASNVLRASRETALPISDPLDGRGSLRYLLLYAAVFALFFLAFAGLQALVPLLFPIAASFIVYAGAALPVGLLIVITVRKLRFARRQRMATDYA